MTEQGQDKVHTSKFGLQYAVKFCQWNREDIQRLVRLKDRHAIALAKAFNDHARSRLDVKKQNELVAVAKDFILRDLTITERVELERRYGLHEGETHG